MVAGKTASAFVWAVASGVVCLALSTFAVAKPAPPPVAPTSAPVMDARDIEAFFDGLVPLQIESNDIAGMTISIVKDGKVLFAKGYGFSDVEARSDVSPEKTLFRTGSITKLFTWTSVMQLVEQGKVDLDADVNTYLDFKIPPAFGKPVTLRNLMTHRGGFQETLKNLGAQRSGKVDLGKYARENIPGQIYEPGSTPSYSNYGASLAGYIVERVSGEPFDAYVEAHIFKPLGMTNSTVRQPLPKEFEANMSKGYVLGSGEAQDFEIVNGYPAGSQSSTAIDMTKFMMAHLNGGALEQARILKPETTALMHNSVTAIDPRQNGIALGFYEETRNGMRIIGHGGDTVYFHSDLHLIPSQNFGFFVSYNSAGRGEGSPRSPLWRKFLDRYFPYDVPVTEVKKSGLTAADVAGSYISTRRADTSALRLFTEFSQPTVTAKEDGTIVVDAFTGLNGQPVSWVPLGDGVFRSKFGQEKLIFLSSADGQIRMLNGGAGVAIYQRLPSTRNGMAMLGIFIASAGFLLWNLIGWPVAAAVRRHYGIDQGWSGWERFLRFGSMAASAAVLTFVIGFGGVLVGAVTEGPWSMDSTLDPQLHLMQQIGIGGAVASLIAVLNAFQAWSNPIRGMLGRIKETLVALALAGVLWFAWTMNMFDAAVRF